MLFTWDPTYLCIIFHWWHVRSTFTLLLSLVAVAFLTAGYELVREISRRYEASSSEYTNSLPSKCHCSCVRHETKTRILEDGRDDDDQERSSLLWSGKDVGQREKKVRLVKAGLYAVQVFYSFFIM